VTDTFASHAVRSAPPTGFGHPPPTGRVPGYWDLTFTVRGRVKPVEADPRSEPRSGLSGAVEASAGWALEGFGFRERRLRC